MALIPSPNFAFLARHDPLLVQLPTLAERNFADDPNTCVIKLRQFGERLAQQVAARGGIGTLTGESQLDLLDRLKSAGIVPQQTAALFHELRRQGIAQVHKAVAGVAEDDDLDMDSALAACVQFGLDGPRPLPPPARDCVYVPCQPPHPPSTSWTLASFFARLARRARGMLRKSRP